MSQFNSYVKTQINISSSPMSLRKNILDGIRVIDLSQFLSGHHATLFLADL